MVLLRAKLSKETKDILTNKDVIAVDQDPLGIQGFCYLSQNQLETWLKPLADGEWAVCFLNRDDKPRSVSLDWSAYYMNDNLTKRILNAKETEYSIKNLWTKMDMGTTGQPFTAEIPSHDVVMLRLTPVK